MILGVNAAWVAFGRANGRAHPDSDIGTRYPLDGMAAVERVVVGTAPSETAVYECHAPEEERWFRLIAIQVGSGDGRRILVIHRRLAEAPAGGAIRATGIEMALRWQGTRTVCGWCESRSRDPLGAWTASEAPAPAVDGEAVVHGICPACHQGLALDA